MTPYLVVAHVGVHSAAVDEVGGEVLLGDARLRRSIPQLGRRLRRVHPLDQAEDVRRLRRRLHGFTQVLLEIGKMLCPFKF